VEGANTLPYFSTIKSVQWDKGFFILKLVRPLPHELLSGALFHVLCTAGEQRFECFITFQGREGYLQYRFHLPQFLTLSDRRNHKRYPFRPRESAYVILQDAGIPGLGQRVYVVDPWGVTGIKPARFNPLDWLRADDPDISENAMMLADSLVVGGDGKDDGGESKNQKDIVATFPFGGSSSVR